MYAHTKKNEIKKTKKLIKFGMLIVFDIHVFAICFDIS